ncbi:protein-glutamine glutaminase family protein [Streptomyces sp. NPDC052036]|uniref:scabin-related ADP-ribosyltransferase n=1 Tax=Streptomyces sp. NPDC052036 TaxID=3155171 RepID=UPI00342F5A72
MSVPLTETATVQPEATVQQTRERMEALREQARAHEAAYAQWRANQSWTLRSGGLDVSRDPFRAPSADERGTQGQFQVQEQLLAEPVRGTSEAGPRIAQAPRTRSAAQDRLADDAVAGLDRMRQAAAGRDKAYREFEDLLAAHPAARTYDAGHLVRPLREWYADTRTAARSGDEPVLSPGQLTEQTTAKLEAITDGLAARRVTGELFRKHLAATAQRSGARAPAFADSERSAQVKAAFHQALVDELGVQTLVSHPGTELPTAVLEQFTQRYAEARQEWEADRAARQSFAAALVTEGPKGRVDLSLGSIGWNQRTRTWYERRLADLERRYAADHRQASAAQDPAAEIAVLAVQARQAAGQLLARAGRTVEAVEEFRDYTAAAYPHGAWSGHVTSWFTREKNALEQSLLRTLSGRGPAGLASARAEFDRGLADLYRTGDARDGMVRDFDALTADRPAESTTLTSYPTVDWVGEQVDAARQRYIEEREAAEAQALTAEGHIPAPAHATAGDRRVPAWTRVQRELRADHDRRLSDAAAADEREEQVLVLRQEFDEEFAQWARSARHGLDDEQLQQVREAAWTHHDKAADPTAAGKDRAVQPADAFDAEVARLTATARGRVAFDRAFRAWRDRLEAPGQGRWREPPLSLRPEIAEAARALVAARFEEQLREAVDQVFPAYTDLSEGQDARLRQAAAALRGLTSTLVESFELAAVHAARQELLGKEVGRLADGAFRDHLDEDHRTLLEEFGPKDTAVSPEGRQAVLAQAAQALHEAFTKAAGRVGRDGQADGLAELNRQADDLAAGLAAKLADQAAREQVVRGALRRVDEAVTAWESEPPALSAAFTRRFDISPALVRPRAQTAVGTAVAAEAKSLFDKLVDGSGALDSRLEEFRSGHADLMAAGRIDALLLRQTARHVGSLAADDVFAAGLARWREAVGGTELSEAGVDRAKSGWRERVLSAFDSAFGGEVKDIADLTGGLWSWDARLRGFADRLPDHFAFESAVPDVLHGAARAADALGVRHVVSEDRLRRADEAFRDDVLGAYERVWSPEAQSPAWVARAAASGVPRAAEAVEGKEWTDVSTDTESDTWSDTWSDTESDTGTESGPVVVAREPDTAPKTPAATRSATGDSATVAQRTAAGSYLRDLHAIVSLRLRDEWNRPPESLEKVAERFDALDSAWKRAPISAVADSLARVIAGQRPSVLPKGGAPGGLAIPPSLVDTFGPGVGGAANPETGREVSVDVDDRRGSGRPAMAATAAQAAPASRVREGLRRRAGALTRRLLGGSPDAGVNPLTAQRPIGLPITLDGPRYGGVTPVADVPAVPAADAARREWFSYVRPSASRSEPFSYAISDTGHIELPSAPGSSWTAADAEPAVELLSPTGWTRFGDDFVHETGAYLRGDNGWLGRLGNSDAVLGGLRELGSEAAPYRLAADPSSIYLIPLRQGPAALRIPLSDDTVPSDPDNRPADAMSVDSPGSTLWSAAPGHSPLSLDAAPQTADTGHDPWAVAATLTSDDREWLRADINSILRRRGWREGPIDADDAAEFYGMLPSSDRRGELRRAANTIADRILTLHRELGVSGPGVGRPEPTADDAYHADYVNALLEANPVDIVEVLTVLHRRSSILGEEADGFSTAFQRTNGISLATALDNAVRAGRLAKEHVQDVLRELGFVGVFPIENREPGHIAVPPDGVPHLLPAVVAYTERLRAAVVDRDAETALGMLVRLDRDVRKLWAVSDAWQAAAADGTDLRAEVADAFPEHAARFSYALGSVSTAPLSREQALRWYDRLATLPVHHHAHGTFPVPVGHPEDGCQVRAHLWTLALLQGGVATRKAIVARMDPPLFVVSSNAAKGTNQAPGVVSWDYHIAPTAEVMTEDGTGQTVTMVFDPAIAERPVTVAEWIGLAGVGPDEPVRSYEGPLDEVHAEFVRQYEEHENEWVMGRMYLPRSATVVLTDNHCYYFPAPDAVVVPMNLAFTDGLVRRRGDAAYEWAVEADRRTLSRGLWDVLLDPLAPVENPAGALREVIGRHRPPGADFLTIYHDLDEKLQARLSEADYQEIAVALSADEPRTDPFAIDLAGLDTPFDGDGLDIPIDWEAFDSAVAEVFPDGLPQVFGGPPAPQRGGLRGGSPNTVVGSAPAVRRTRRPVMVERPRYGGVTELPAHEVPSAGKAAERWFAFGRGPASPSAMPAYEVSSAGRIRLADGTLLPSDGWLRIGDDLMHQTAGVLLRGDTGAILPLGHIAAPNAVTTGPDGSAVPYAVIADERSMYLFPDGSADATAIRVPLQVDTAARTAVADPRDGEDEHIAAPNLTAVHGEFDAVTGTARIGGAELDAAGTAAWIRRSTDWRPAEPVALLLTGPEATEARKTFADEVADHLDTPVAAPDGAPVIAARWRVHPPARPADEFARLSPPAPPVADTVPEIVVTPPDPEPEGTEEEEAVHEAPWYLERRALGEARVVGVLPWDGDAELDGAADATAGAAHREGDSAALAAGIRGGVRDLLGTASREGWQRLLQRGRTLVADGRLVWLRPVAAAVEPAEQPEEGDVRVYGVSFASATSGGVREHQVSMELDGMLLSILAIASQVASTLLPGLPRLAASVAQSWSEEWKRSIVAGRKLFVTKHTRFDSGLRVLVFVDGEERGAAPVLGHRLALDIPEEFATTGGPAPAPAEPVVGPALARARTRRPDAARDILNAIDLIPAVAALQRRLLGAGLPATSVHTAMDKVLGLLNEQSVRNRSRVFGTSGVVTEKITVPAGRNALGLPTSFQGHFVLSADIDRVQYLGETKSKIREDSGGAHTVAQARQSMSKAATGFAFDVLGFHHDESDGAAGGHGHSSQTSGFAPLTGVTLSHQRPTGHQLTEQSAGHTVLSQKGRIARYLADQHVTVEIRSTTHTIDPVREEAASEIAVLSQDAAEFERRLLGTVHTPVLRTVGQSGDLPVAAQPYVRALLREAALPLPDRVYRRPARLDEPLPAPHPREPLALATRRGQGLGMQIALPGSELVHDQLRAEILRADIRRHGHPSDWSKTDLDMSTWFSRPALEGDLPEGMYGIEHTVRVGGRDYRAFVRIHLRERVTDDPRTLDMTVNARAQQAAQVKGHRGTEWQLKGGAGAGARVGILDWLRVKIGGFGVEAGYGQGGGQAHAGIVKSYRRTETSGDVDEHLYSVVYELAVRGPDGLTKRWWIDRPTTSPDAWWTAPPSADIVARIVVPEPHLPAQPIDAGTLALAGRTEELLFWPDDEYADFADNTSGVYPAFFVIPELPRLAARLYAEANGLPESFTGDDLRWPEGLRETGSPGKLAAFFGAETGIGRTIALPKGKDGWKQAIRLRLRGYRPRHLVDDDKVELEQYAQVGADHQRGREHGWQGGPSGSLGPQFHLGHGLGSKGMAADAHVQGTEGQKPFMAAGVHARVGVRATRKRKKTVQRSGTAITRATYGGNEHAFRMDPVFEVTFQRWKGSRLTETTRYLRVRDALETLVPERLVHDLALAELAGLAPRPAAGPPSHHIHPALLPGSGYPERLRADNVLPAITAELRARGVLRTETEPDAERANLLLRELENSFSGESLRNQYARLTAEFGGVERWLPLPRAFGATTYLRVKVTAQVREATSESPRPDVRLTLRVQTQDQDGEKHTRGVHYGADVDAHVLGGKGDGEGGLEGGAGYEGAVERSAEEADRRLEIYRANPSDASHEFEHRLEFTVEMGVSTELPEILEIPLRGATSLFRRGAELFGRGRDAADWWYGHRPFVWSSERRLAGDVRILVSSHLVEDGPGLDPVPVPGTGAAWHRLPMQPALAADRIGEPPNTAYEVLAEALHPFAVPAAAAVHRWAALAAAPFRPPADLSVDGAWRVPGLEDTLAGVRYRHFAGAAMLLPNILELLTHTYRVPVGDDHKVTRGLGGGKLPVGDRSVLVGANIVRAERVGPRNGALFKARHYTQDDKEALEEAKKSGGFVFSIGPQAAGADGERDIFLALLPVQFGFEDAAEQSGRLDETEENNRQGTSRFGYYGFDLELQFSGPRGILRVSAPSGLFGMLPLEKEPDATGRYRAAGSLEELLPDVFGADIERAAAARPSRLAVPEPRPADRPAPRFEDSRTALPTSPAPAVRAPVTAPGRSEGATALPVSGAEAGSRAGTVGTTEAVDAAGSGHREGNAPELVVRRDESFSWDDLYDLDDAAEPEGLDGEEPRLPPESREDAGSEAGDDSSLTTFTSISPLALGSLVVEGPLPASAVPTDTGDIRPAPIWYTGGPVYRADSRDLSVIFGEGFRPRGSNLDLEGYVRLGTGEGTHHGFVGAAPSSQAAADSLGEGWVVEIDAAGGIDVSETLGAYGIPFTEAQEVAYAGGVASRHLVGAWAIVPGGTAGNTLGEWHPNPNYRPSGPAESVAAGTVRITVGDPELEAEYGIDPLVVSFEDNTVEPGKEGHDELYPFANNLAMAVQDRPEGRAAHYVHDLLKSVVDADTGLAADAVYHITVDTAEPAAETGTRPAVLVDAPFDAESDAYSDTGTVVRLPREDAGEVPGEPWGFGPQPTAARAPFVVPLAGDLASALWIGDPEPEARAAAVADLTGAHADEGVLTLALRPGEDGLPTHEGFPLLPAQIAERLALGYADGTWHPSTPLRWRVYGGEEGLSAGFVSKVVGDLWDLGFPTARAVSTDPASGRQQWFGEPDHAETAGIEPPVAAAEGGDQEVAAPSDVELQYPAHEFWNTPSGSAVGVPRGIAEAVRSGVAGRLGDESWWASRGGALPQRREHRWTNPVALSRDARGELAPTTVNAAFDARRFRHGGETYTDLEVRVAFRNADWFAGRAVNDLWERMGSGVEEVFNAPGHRLPNGDLLHVTPVRVPFESRAGAHWKARLFGEDSGERVSHHRLRIDMSALTGAHEFGHQLGLPDESRRLDEPDSGQYVPGSLMGVFTKPVDAVADAEPEQELAGGGLSRGGLRDRHMWRLGGIIGDVPLTAGPVAVPRGSTGVPASGIDPAGIASRWVGGDPTAPEDWYGGDPMAPEEDLRGGASGGGVDQAGSGEYGNSAVVLVKLAAAVADKRAAVVGPPRDPAIVGEFNEAITQDPAIEGEFYEAITAFGRALAGSGDGVHGGPAGGEVARYLSAALTYFVGEGNLDVPSYVTVTLGDGGEVRLGEWLSGGLDADQVWVKPVLAALDPGWGVAGTLAEGEAGAAVSAGGLVTSGGEGGQVGSGEDSDLAAAVPEPAAAFGADVAAGSPGQHVAVTGDVSQNGSARMGTIGGQGGSTEGLAEKLGTWAEAVAGAYGGDRWSGEARGAFERLERGLGGVLAGLSGNVPRYLRAALKFYLENGHVNAPQRKPVVLADGPVQLGGWLSGLRRGEGAGRGLVEPFLTALGWGDEEAVRAARERLAEWWGSLAKAVDDAYVRDPNSNETHHAVEAFKGELGIDRGRRTNQVAGHLRASLAHYLENNGDVNAPKLTKLGVWQADLRSSPTPHRDLARPSMTALRMRRERIRGVGMGRPWPDARVLPGEGAGPAASVEQPAMFGGEGGSTEGLAERLGTWAEAVAGAYGGERWSGEARGAFERLERELGGGLAGLSDTVPGYLRAALKFYLENGHVNAPQRKPVVLADGPVQLGDWLYNLRRDQGAGRGLVEPFLTALGWGDEEAVRAARERLAEWWGSLAKAVADAYVRNPNSNETHRAVEAFAGDLDIGWDGPSGQVAGHLRAALAHYLENDGDVNAPVRTKLGHWQDNLRSRPGLHRDLAWRSMTALGMRREKFRDLDMGMPWPDARVLPGEGAGPAASVEQPAMSGGEGGDADPGYVIHPGAAMPESAGGTGADEAGGYFGPYVPVGDDFPGEVRPLEPMDVDSPGGNGIESAELPGPDTDNPSAYLDIRDDLDIFDDLDDLAFLHGMGVLDDTGVGIHGEGGQQYPSREADLALQGEDARRSQHGDAMSGGEGGDADPGYVIHPGASALESAGGTGADEAGGYFGPYMPVGDDFPGEVRSLDDGVFDGGVGSAVPFAPFAPFSQSEDLLDWLSGSGGAQASELGLDLDADLPVFGQEVQPDHASGPYVVEQGVAPPVPVDRTGLESFDDTTAHQPMDVDVDVDPPSGNGGESFVERAESPGPDAGNPGSYLDILDDLVDLDDQEGQDFLFGTTVHQFMEWDPSHQDQQGHFAEPAAPLILETDNPGFGVQGPPVDAVHGNRLVWRGVQQDLPPGSDRAPHDLTPGPQNDSTGIDAVGGEGGATEELAERLGTWAEAVAGAYGGERWSGEARGAFERLERGLGGVLAGLSGNVPRYLRAALKFYLENGHVNAPQRKPVVLDDGPVHLGLWLSGLRRDEGAGRGLVEPFLTALGWGDEEAVRAARERLSEWWGSLAKAVDDAYVRDPNSNETHHAVEAFKRDLGIDRGRRTNQVAGHLRASLAHYLENNGNVNAPKLTTLGVWQADLRSSPTPRRDLAGPSMTALRMRWERIRGVGMGMPWPDEGGDADLRSVREARLVRDPGAPEGDLTHPEWDLTQPEWDLIKRPLEEAVPKVAPGDVRRYFNAVMYRARNGLAMNAAVPRDPDRYHAISAGTKQFYTWARAGALRKVWIIVSDSPEVHHVVRDAVKAVFGVAEDYLDREGLKSIPSVTRGAAQPPAQGNSDGDEAR